MKKILSFILYSGNLIHNSLKRIPLDATFVFTYHKIVFPSQIQPWSLPGMYVLSSTLDMHLSFLRMYFNLCSFQSLNHDYQNISSSPNCIITFDDGWRDFYDNAFPVLKRHSVPATVFLPTGYIGTNKRFWTDRLGRALYTLSGHKKEKKYVLRSETGPLVDFIFHLKGSFSSKLEQSILLLKQYPSDTIENVLSCLERLSEVNTYDERTFLSWKEVRTLKESGLVSFGSHTVNHSILTNIQDDNELDMELSESKSELISRGAVRENEPVPFCYPNGNYNQAIKEKVSRLYDWACTTKSGMNDPDCDPFALRRVGLHQDMSKSKGLLGCKILGLI